MQIALAVSTWLHAMATAVFIGYYLVLALVIVPALAPTHSGHALASISKRSRPWLYTSLVVFFVTGLLMMVVDPSYEGFMKMGNGWSILMLVKHVLVLAMIVLGAWYNALKRVGPLMQVNDGVDSAIARFRSYAVVMAVLGGLVLLLTAFAQVA